MLEQTAPYVAHHFDDAEQQHDASALGMWFFLAQEVMSLALAHALQMNKYGA